MDNQKFKKFFADFWNIDSSLIDNNMPLDDTSLPGQTSIRLYQFFAKIEKHFGVEIQNINEIFTYGDLIKNIK